MRTLLHADSASAIAANVHGLPVGWLRSLLHSDSVTRSPLRSSGQRQLRNAPDETEIKAGQLVSKGGAGAQNRWFESNTATHEMTCFGFGLGNAISVLDTKTLDRGRDRRDRAVARSVTIRRASRGHSLHRTTKSHALRESVEKPFRARWPIVENCLPRPQIGTNFLRLEIPETTNVGYRK